MFGQGFFFFQHMWPGKKRKEGSRFSVRPCACVSVCSAISFSSPLAVPFIWLCYCHCHCHRLAQQCVYNCSDNEQLFFIFHFSAMCFLCFLFRCLLVDCRRGRPLLGFLTCFWIFHIVCIHFALSVPGGGAQRCPRSYLLCKEASKRSPFFRQYEMGSHTQYRRESLPFFQAN